MDRRHLLTLAAQSAVPLAALAGAPSLAAARGALASPPAGKNENVPSAHATAILSVRQFGAVGDGSAIDSPAINRAIEAAAKNGGGTVFFPAGTYASYSIRLKSNVSLYLDQGA